MEERKYGIRWPDGYYVSFSPSLPGIIGGNLTGTYYRNPGSDTAPSVTISGGLGLGRDVFRFGPGLGIGATFLRNGMTSADTLGYGTSTNVSTIVPSVTLNSSIPDENYIPQIGKSKVSSVEAGLSTSVGASTSGTATVTPRQISDALITPAMGPIDQLSPFARILRSGVGTVGAPGAPPIRYLSSRRQNPLGDQMEDWKSSVDPVDTPRQARPQTGPGGSLPSSGVFTNGAPPVPFLPQRAPRGLPAMLAEAAGFDPSNPEAPPAGGLPGLIQEYLRNH